MTATNEDITILCKNGNHGSPERRTVAKEGWENMYQGTCAGTLFNISTAEELPCACPCHTADATRAFREDDRAAYARRSDEDTAPCSGCDDVNCFECRKEADQDIQTLVRRDQAAFKRFLAAHAKLHGRDIATLSSVGQQSLL